MMKPRLSVVIATLLLTHTILSQPENPKKSPSPQKTGNPQQNQQTAQQTYNNANNEGQDFYVDPLQENIIHQEEQFQDKQQEQNMEDAVSVWIAEESQNYPQADALRAHEIFAEDIVNEIQFKWDPSEYKSGPLKFVVSVYQWENNQFYLPQNPSEYQGIEVLAKPHLEHKFRSLGKVYTKRLFTIHFFNDYQIILLQNNYGKKMLVNIGLEATRFVPVNALADDSLKIPTEKIASILQEIKQTEISRERTFQLELNLLQRTQNHQSQMLILTGVQLSVILFTSIMQMYCIKSLFDNRLIV